MKAHRSDEELARLQGDEKRIGQANQVVYTCQAFSFYRYIYTQIMLLQKLRSLPVKIAISIAHQRRSAPSGLQQLEVHLSRWRWI